MKLGPNNSALIVLLTVLVGTIIGFIASIRLGLWALVGGVAGGVILGLIIVAAAFPGTDQSDDIKMAGQDVWDIMKWRAGCWGCGGWFGGVLVLALALAMHRH